VKGETSIVPKARRSDKVKGSTLRTRAGRKTRGRAPTGTSFAFVHETPTARDPTTEATMNAKHATKPHTGNGPATTEHTPAITRQKLIDLLNEDLAREYQAIIAYTVYSQVLKGPEYMSVAGELEKHAKQELDHAMLIAKQIDYLGGMPTVTPKPVRTSEQARDMLRFDLENENETVRNYRERVRQCEALGEYALAELIRGILVNEQDHQIDLATALGEDVPDVTRPSERA
jgi:bacterioferritin